MAVEPHDPSISDSAGRGRGAYPIPLTRITTAGFLGRTERGPISEPICVESFAEYCRYFGGHAAGQAVSFAVQDFFLHGGRRAVVVRVVNRAARARIDLPAGHERLCLEARYPGRHEILRVSIDHEQVEDDPCQFNMVVQRLDSAATKLIEDQEIYPLISTRRSDARYIGNVLKDSRLVALSGPPPVERPDAMTPRHPGEPMRYVGLTAPGDDGDELTDYDIIGSNRDGTGLFAFGLGPRIDVLAIPLPPQRELGSTAFVAAARYCESRRALMIWDPPWAWQSADQAVLGARRLDYAAGNVLTYFPRVRPRGARARFEGGLAASGAIAGMLAQRDRRGLWAAGEDLDYTLRPALTPVQGLTMREARRLGRYGFNAFVQATGAATRLVGRVTLGSAGLGSSSSLDQRRLAFFILNSIEDAATAAAADGDPSAALPRVAWQIRRFLDELYQHGALSGRTPGQAYYLETRRAIDDAAGLRFGIALDEPCRFVEYAVHLNGAELKGTLRRVKALDVAKP